ncbi:MAG: OadG family protein [Clostridia bacterium]|nr:OadG family protein [Clostridia bacterium]
MLNLLNTTLDKFREVSLGEVSVYALLGFSVVFAGIIFLIFVLWGLGKVMSQAPKAPTTQKTTVKPAPALAEEALAVADVDTDTISEETVAVIMAALMAYYQSVGPKCEFTVKRIKRI